MPRAVPAELVLTSSGGHVLEQHFPVVHGKTLRLVAGLVMLADAHRALRYHRRWHCERVWKVSSRMLVWYHSGEGKPLLVLTVRSGKFSTLPVDGSLRESFDTFGC